MNASSTQLLRLLGSGVRPDAGATSTIAGGPAGQAAFADLLKQAREGTLTSKAPVTVAGEAEVSCSEDQLARLSLGADKLEAAGVHTALVTIDGQQLVLDVHSRQITGAATPENGVISGIDGVLDLGDARSGTQLSGATQAPGATTARAPAGLAQNQSLMKLLAELSGA